MNTTISHILRKSECLLSEIGSPRENDSPRLDVELLLCHVLEKPRTYLFTHPEYELNTEQSRLFERLLQRRLGGEPVAYLIGHKGFWTLDLAVSPATLIPRPETELLVEMALALSLPHQARVLDLGTGTGAIALALASERTQWQITAVDVSVDAVALAECNRRTHKLSNVVVQQSHWFEAVAGQHFDLIVSNPPYIDSEDIHLQQGDVRFEPASALVAADQGLADIRHIVGGAKAFLKKGGWLLLEHGWQQGEVVNQLLQSAGYQCVETVQDLSGHDRVAKGCWV